ncbi:MAG: hypothetical protein AB7I27_17860 [Bacteriovoracaceae bacterium]
MKKLITLILCLNLTTLPVVHATNTSSMVYKNQILTLVDSSLGANIMLTCTTANLQPSMWAFMAGSIAHLMAEVTAGKKIKDVHERNEKEIEDFKKRMKPGGDLQRETIEQMLNDEKEKLSFVEKRLRWMNAVKAMYGVASALAIVEIIRETGTFGVYNSFAGCSGNILPAKASLLGIVGAYTLANVKTGGLLETMLFLFLPIHGSMVPAMYNFATQRTISFGASAVLVSSIVSDLNNIQSVLNGNISKLQTLLTQFQIDTEANGGVNQGTLAAKGESEALKKGEISRLAKVAVKQNKDCFSMNNGKIVTGASACATSMKLSSPKFDPNFKLPTLQAISNMAKEAIEARASGDSEKADMLAGSIASNAARIDAINKDLMKKANEVLKSNKKEPIDIEKQTSNQLAGMNSQFDKAMSANKTPLPAFSATPSESASQKGENKSASSLPEVEKKSELPAASTPISLTEDLGESNENKEEKVASLSDSLEEYETAENDISKQPDVSIFKQLSNRYLLNYTKIFDRKNLTENAP